MLARFVIDWQPASLITSKLPATSLVSYYFEKLHAHENIHLHIWQCVCACVCVCVRVGGINSLFDLLLGIAMAQTH